MLTFSYARLEITLTLLLGTLITAATANFLNLWALLPAGITLALLAFYRNPPRHTPEADNIIVAPADGIIVEISRAVPGPDETSPVLRIMIFLRVYDVHVNRSPCTGRVSNVVYRPGKFLNALKAEADTSNECNTISIDPRLPLPGPIRVRQIAGVLARRIVCKAQSGDNLLSGQSFGMIKLGSRTEVCLPEHPGWEITVKIGQKVAAGQTILARLTSAVQE